MAKGYRPVLRDQGFLLPPDTNGGRGRPNIADVTEL
jgi:hypothetical protein